MDSNVYRERLVNRRKELGLTQQELADTLGVHYRTVSRWERGLAMPELTPEKMANLCRSLKCSIEELAEMFANPSQPSS